MLRLSHAPTRTEIQPRSAVAPTPAGPHWVSRSRGIASKYGAGSDAAPGPGGGAELRGRARAPLRGPTAALPTRDRGRPADAGNRMRPRSSRTERPRDGGRTGMGRASPRTAQLHAGSPSGAPSRTPPAPRRQPPPHAACRRGAAAPCSKRSPLPLIPARRRPALAGPRRPLPVPYLSAAEQRAGARRGCAAVQRHRPLPAPPPPAAHAPGAARRRRRAERSRSARPGPAPGLRRAAPRSVPAHARPRPRAAPHGSAAAATATPARARRPRATGQWQLALPASRGSGAGRGGAGPRAGAAGRR